MQDGRSRYLVPAVLAAAALVVGLLLGRLSESESSDGDASRARRDPGPTDVRNGVPVGYSRTRQGAVAAATNYLTVLSSAVVVDRDRRHRAISAMATPRFGPRFERAFGAASRESERGPIGQGIRAGEPTVFQAAHLGYRVLGHSSARARVSVWSVALAGNAVNAPPRMGWQTNTFALRWLNSDWKLNGFSGEVGPTPETPEGTEPTPASEFVNEVARLRSYRYVP